MTMPRKGSRKLEVLGVAYRWTVKRSSSGWNIGDAPRSMRLVVVAEQTDNTMMAKLRSRRIPLDEDQTHKASIAPKDIAEAIVAAQAGGWDPELRNPAVFELQPPVSLTDYEVLGTR